VHQERGFARAVGADDAYRLAMGNAERNIAQCFRAIRIAEGNTSKFDDMVTHENTP